MAQPGTVTKRRFDRRIAIRAAKEICDVIMPHCERIVVAGSLRRRRKLVGDVEIVYVPKWKEEAGLDFFEIKMVNLVDVALEHLIQHGVIARRRNVNGSEVWGEKNKLAVHVATEIPMDFFSTTLDAWFNYLVCRTGGAKNNTVLAEAYQRLGRRWNPYKAGYTDKDGTEKPNKSEADVYLNAGLKYRHPWERD